MSAVEELNEAVRAFAAETGKAGVVVDWVIGYVTMTGEDGFTYDYSTAGTTPHAAVGLLDITSDMLSADLSGGAR